MNQTIERPLVIVMFSISLLLLFAYVFYISFLKKTIDEGQIISTDVRNIILSSIRNNTGNDIDDDDLLAKIMLRKELIQKNIFVRQIQRQESVRELSRLLAISRSEVGVNADEEIGGLQHVSDTNESVDDHGDGCGEDAAPVRRICRRRRQDDPECSICLEHYSPNDIIAWAKDGGEAPAPNGNSNTIVTSTGCAHIFHKQCLFAWLQDHDGCPLCRRRVVHSDAHVRFAGW
jgi:hypothetical protein